MSSGPLGTGAYVYMSRRIRCIDHEERGVFVLKPVTGDGLVAAG